MKHSRMTAGSIAGVLSPLARLTPLAVLGPLVGLAAGLAGTLPARGQDVPFTERLISTKALGAISVFATDVDGDGDTDVLSASCNDDKIAWYENTTQLEPTVLLENVVQQVLALNLQQGIENSLDAKLDAAQQAIQDVNDNNDVAACNSLQAFINAVDAQGGNQICQEDADALSAAVQEIMVALGCS